MFDTLDTFVCVFNGAMGFTVVNWFESVFCMYFSDIFKYVQCI